MTTQELHIEIDLLFQKVNSHYNQNIQPSEKDLLLNREILRYVNKLINPLNSLKGQAAFDVVKKTVELAPLLKTYDAPVLIDNNKKEAKVLLPFDCLYPVASRLHACPTCINKPLINQNIYTLELPVITDRNQLPLYILQGNTTISIQPSDIPDAYLLSSTLPYLSNQFLINNALLILLKSKTKEIEFTYDKQLNKIIARSYRHFSCGNLSAIHTNYNKYESFESDLYAEVIMEDEEFLFKANNSYLSKSKDKSVLSYIREQELNLYLPKGVIYDTLRLVYIQKPKKIDVYLNSNSNLTDEALTEVVANLVQRLHGIIGTDNYEKYVRENTIIE